MSQQREPILRVVGLKQYFPVRSGFFNRQLNYVRAVDDVSFDVYPGETLGIVGESGCGKSTTVRSLSQLYKPTAGEVWFQGKDLCKASEKELLLARKDMQMIFQDPYASLDPRMTVRTIIAEPLHIYNNRGMLDHKWTDKEIEQRVEDLMDRCGLNILFKNRYPHEFSGGQRQRIGIARALALNPKIILADEPVSALDVSIQAQILNLLGDLQQELGLTYIFIAHDLAVIQHISTRVMVMYLGASMETADALELYANPLHPYTQALLSAAPIPDPKIERKRQRIILTGDVPSPDKEYHGCRFYDRCPKKMEFCKNHIPVFHEVKPGHKVNCWLYDPDLQKKQENGN